MSLADLKPGVEAVIEGLMLGDNDAQRLMEFGFIPGTSVGCSGRSPMGDPVVYQIDGSEVALRLETARQIAIRMDPAPAG